MFDFIKATDGSDRYNFHTHTEFCDGRSSMREMAESAAANGFSAIGFSPHAPVPLESPCNMAQADFMNYIEEAKRLRSIHSSPHIYIGVESDYMGRSFGPHTENYRSRGADYVIGSVHFVPTQKGDPIDCDGSAERFARNLHDRFGGDLRYVVEKYFAQVGEMISLGGIDMLGHADKIADNASSVQPDIEESGWYTDAVQEIISEAASKGLTIEINTKKFESRGRFFPAERWWDEVIRSGCPIAVNSDAHYASKLESGRTEALARLKDITSNYKP